MQLTQKRTWGLVWLLPALVGGCATALVSRPLLSSAFAADGARQPMTLNFRVASFHGEELKAGTIHDQMTVSMRSDGTTSELLERVSEVPGSGGRSETIRTLTVLDRTAASQTIVYPHLGLKTTLRHAASSAANPGRDANCVGPGEKLAQPATTGLSMLGFAVSVVRQEGRQGDYLYRITDYRAPALGCVLLKQESDLLSANGALVTRKLTEATAVSKGEPDPARFVVPQQYREAPPSEVHEAELRYRGEQNTDCARSTGARADERYYRLRSERNRK